MTDRELPRIVRIVGRWARLDDGSWVTPVPSFRDLGFSTREFDRRIAAFQRDPAGELDRLGIVDRTRSVKSVAE